MILSKLATLMPAFLPTGISLEMIGPPGIGKSEFVRDLRDTMSARTGKRWGFTTMFLATQSPIDLVGYLFKGEMTHAGRTFAITEPTLPLWMMTTNERGELVPVWEYEHGILLLDEYGQGDPDTKRASAELLLNRRLGTFALPPGWSVFACSNGANHRSGVTKTFDFVINRRVQVEIEHDIDGWVSWAINHDVHPVCIAFAQQNPQIVFGADVPKEQGPWCTPRSLVMADKILRGLSKDGGATLPIDPLSSEFVGGLIGPAAMAQLTTFIRIGQELPTKEEIFKNPTTAKVPDAPDGMMLVAYMLAMSTDAGSASAAIKYVDRLPQEFAVMFLKAATKKSGNPLVNSAAFGQWGMRNASLFMAVSDTELAR